MLIVRSTCSCAMACGGNKARETWRSVPVRAGKDGGFPSDGDVASPNASELDSASLHHQWRSASLPEMAKPVIDGEATDTCTRRAARGDWRERVTKERIRYPGDPFRCPASAVEAGRGDRGSHNPALPRQWKSDRLTVALKRGNARGAKRPGRRRVSTVKGGAA